MILIWTEIFLCVVFVQSVCHEISIAGEGFVAILAGISGFYEGIAWELTSHCGCRWLQKQLKLLVLFLINKIDLIIVNFENIFKMNQAFHDQIIFELHVVLNKV